MAPIAEKAYDRGTTVYLQVFVPVTEEMTDENGNPVIPSQEAPEDDM